MSRAEPTLAFADQLCINEFNRLHQFGKQLREELQSLGAARQRFENCREELEFVEGDVDFAFADCFLCLSVERAAAANARRLAEVERAIADKSARRAATAKRLRELKESLKAKFGDSIQLDE